MEKRELRLMTSALNIEKRAEGDSEKTILVGHAAVFNQRTNIGYFEEVVLPGAFRETLDAGADVVALIEHDMSKPVARTRDGGKTGSLRLSEDEIGLRVEIEVVDTTEGQDLIKKVRAGIIDAMSFGFSLRKDGDSWYEDRDGKVVRELKNLNLYDVSPVAFPAYPQTDLSEKKSGDRPFEVRSVNEVFESRPETLEKRSKTEEKEQKEAKNEPKEDEIRLIIREELSRFFEKKEEVEASEERESEQKSEEKTDEMTLAEKISKRKQLLKKITVEKEILSV